MVSNPHDYVSYKGKVISLEDYLKAHPLEGNQFVAYLVSLIEPVLVSQGKEGSLEEIKTSLTDAIQTSKGNLNRLGIKHWLTELNLPIQFMKVDILEFLKSRDMEVVNEHTWGAVGFYWECMVDALEILLGLTAPNQ